MKILLITAEEWNDYTFANGVLANWFTGFHAEFAQIYLSPGLPINNICDKYFQITDGQMAKSIIGGSKAGIVIVKQTKSDDIEFAKQNAKRRGIYGFMKKVSLWFHSPVLMLRDFIWAAGKVDIEAIRFFVSEFNPDVVFCPRMATPAILKVERIVHSLCNAPFIAFTADNEASYKCVSYSPLFWIRRWYTRRALKKTMPIYMEYLMFSRDQAREYNEEYGIKTGTLFKCGDFQDTFETKPVGTPIRMVYAGRLYCNRWKSLAAIGEALHTINKDGVKMVLDIYTQEVLTSEQAKHLNEVNYIYIKGSVPGSELPRIYRKADIALHVESFDEKNKYATRVSFSTKIIDLMASTCAILAICWNQHAGYQYLEEHNAAICIDSYEKLLPQLQKLVNEPTLIQEYAKKAYDCGKENHSREKIHQQLKSIFEKYINQ